GTVLWTSIDEFTPGERRRHNGPPHRDCGDRGPQEVELISAHQVYGMTAVRRPRRVRAGTAHGEGGAYRHGSSANGACRASAGPRPIISVPGPRPPFGSPKVITADFPRQPNDPRLANEFAS